MIHPTSKLIFDFLDETGRDGGELYPFLRLFIANEYDRDKTVADRLKETLEEIKEAWEDQEPLPEPHGQRRDEIIDADRLKEALEEIKPEPHGQRRDEIIDMVLEAHDHLKEVTRPMTNYERLFFCEALIKGVGCARDEFQKYCDEGFGDLSG